MPFLSYGGSSMLAIMGGFGLLMNCYINQRINLKKNHKIRLHIITLTAIDLIKLFTCGCILYYFLFLKLRAAPIPIPAAIHNGSFVAANIPAPTATPTAISAPAFQEDLVLLFIIPPNIKYYNS